MCGLHGVLSFVAEKKNLLFFYYLLAWAAPLIRGAVLGWGMV